MAGLTNRCLVMHSDPCTPLALALQDRKPGQSRREAVNKARLGLAYLGSAWLSLRPCKALVDTYRA